MPGTTPIYGFPYQVGGDSPDGDTGLQDLAEAAEATIHDLPNAKLLNSGTQSIPNSADTKLVYNSVDFDSYAANPGGAMADATNDWITIRKTGLYLVIAKVWFAANATGTRRLGLKNGASVLDATDRINLSANAISLHLSNIYSLTAADVLTTYTFQSSGGALNATNNTITHGFSLAVHWAGPI